MNHKETRIYELVMAADHYHETGTISEVLLTCFNQRGKWIETIPGGGTARQQDEKWVRFFFPERVLAFW